MPPVLRSARASSPTRKGEGAVSDAGPELYPRSVAGFQAPDEWPPCWRRKLDTGGPDWRETLPTLASWIRNHDHNPD